MELNDFFFLLGAWAGDGRGGGFVRGVGGEGMDVFFWGGGFLLVALGYDWWVGDGRWGGRGWMFFFFWGGGASCLLL